MTRPSRTFLAALAAVTSVSLVPGPAHAVPHGEESVAAPVEARERHVAGLLAVPGDSWVVLRGHGWGHGHGMSQYGAGGAAAAGLTWQQILDFYYPGTRRGAATGEIRVLLTGDTTPDLVVRHQPGLQLVAGGTTTVLPDGVTDQWRLALTPRGPRLQRRDTAAGTLRWRPDRPVPADTALEQLRPAVGDLTAVEVVGREGGGEWGGRVTTLRLVGTTGTATVPGDEVKARLGLKERWFTLVGARRR